jgi:hypothetical protein
LWKERRKKGGRKKKDEERRAEDEVLSFPSTFFLFFSFFSFTFAYAEPFYNAWYAKVL